MSISVREIENKKESEIHIVERVREPGDNMKTKRQTKMTTFVSHPSDFDDRST